MSLRSWYEMQIDRQLKDISSAKGALIVGNDLYNTSLLVGTNNSVLVADSVQTLGVKWKAAEDVTPTTRRYNLTATANYSTTSTSYVTVNTMTVTPVAGTYAVWFSAGFNGNLNDQIVTFGVFEAGVVLPETERVLHGNTNATTKLIKSCAVMQTIVQTTGSKLYEVKVKTNFGTATVSQRTFTLIRIE